MRSPLLALVVLLSLSAAAQAKGKPAAPKAAECTTDADCVLVPDGCCGCNEGGKQRAIPAHARDGYEKKRKTACRSSACPALMSEDASCVSAHPVCKEKRCTLSP